MKPVAIRFFSPQENKLPIQKKGKADQHKKVVLTGYISNTGKLVFPAKTVTGLGLDVDRNSFKVGMQAGKRKVKSLYLIPATDSQDDTFRLEKAAKSYTLSLPVILKTSGVDFSSTKYSFLIELFDYEGTTAFVLQLSKDEAAPKVAYTGKPRGRKPKATE